MSALRANTPLYVDVQVAADGYEVPADAQWRVWVAAALSAADRAVSGAVTVRLVDTDESAALNESYRHKPGPTNVLAFSGPGEPPVAGVNGTQDDMSVEPELGDLVICLPLAGREAAGQGKSLLAHLAHLVVHGTLHLIGYDHGNEVDAGRMESLEIRIMDGLGFANPYAGTK